MLASARLCFILVPEILIHKRSKFVKTFYFCFLSSSQFPPSNLPPPFPLHRRTKMVPRVKLGACISQSWVFFCVCMFILMSYVLKLYQMNTISASCSDEQLGRCVVSMPVPAICNVQQMPICRWLLWGYGLPWGREKMQLQLLNIFVAVLAILIYIT